MRKISKVILFGLVAMMPLAGCDTEELHDLNIDPQSLNVISPNLIFTAAQLSQASGGAGGDNRFLDWRTNIGYTAYWIQQLGTTGTSLNTAGNVYNENFEANEAPWNFFYGDSGKNLAQVLRLTGPGGPFEGQFNNTRQAARILLVLNFHRLTDFYGAVPYTEALQGLGGNFFPKYDKQSEIYPMLLKELDEAAAAFTPGTSDGFNQADIVYEGDITKWKKFAHSLMLRLAMRVSNVAPQLANEYVTKAVAGGTMQDNADSYLVPQAEGPGQWTNQNGISRSFFPGDGGQQAFLNETFVEWLKGDPNSLQDVDPRLNIFSGGIGGNWSKDSFTPGNRNPLEQRGIPAGVDQQMLDAAAGRPVSVPDEFTMINPLLLGLGDPYVLMAYPEVEFLKAEALERGIGSGIQGTVRQHYEEGVRAAMRMWTVFDPSLTVSDAQVAAYLAARPFNEAKALPMIYEQLWASKFLNWWEAWSDWRRTGFPELTPVNHPQGVTGGVIPTRLRYPAQESAVNDNFQAGATTPDLLTTRVWWDGGTE